MKKGFTLAEILITLTIIGVVAALTLPSVMTNVTQNQCKTGLKKAINILNNSIQTNLANEGDTPYNIQDATIDLNGDGKIDGNDLTYNQRYMQGLTAPEATSLASFLMRHLNVVKTKVLYSNDKKSVRTGGDNVIDGIDAANFAFYTVDGLRFEVPYNISPKGNSITLDLYETSEVQAVSNVCALDKYLKGEENACDSVQQRCGSLGLVTNPNRTAAPPCIVIVDVNGDKKPNPKNIKATVSDPGRRGNPQTSTTSFSHDAYTVPDPADNMVSDVFTILITDRNAIPYGTVAQKTMYDEN